MTRTEAAARTKSAFGIVGLVLLLGTIGGVVFVTQCRKEARREDYVTLGMRCLLQADGAKPDELRAKLEATAAAAKRSEQIGDKWPKLCARAFHQAAQYVKTVPPSELAKAAAVRDAIETGDLQKIEAALVPLVAE